MKLNIITSIELIRKNKYYFSDLDEYNQLLNNLYFELLEQNSKSKINYNNIYNLINLLENNKKSFNNDEFNQLQNLLTLELSNKRNLKKIKQEQKQKQEQEQTQEQVLEPEQTLNFTNEEYLNFLQEIISTNDFNKFLQLKKIIWLGFMNPFYKILLKENNLLEIDLTKEKIYFQDKPIIDIYNKKIIVESIKSLLHVIEITPQKKNKIIVSLIIFDYLFKNFKFVSDYPKFKIIFINKINNFVENENENFKQVLNEYDLDKDILYKWRDVLLNSN